MTQKQSTFDLVLDYVILAGLTIVSISLIWSSYGNHSALQNIRQTYLEIDGEIQSTLTSVDNYFELKIQNDSLRLELEKALAAKQRYESSYFELLELKRTVNFRPSDTLQYAYAEVISRNLSDLSKTFTLNRGKADSIQLNDPVIYKSSLVGRVVSVSENYSIVQLVQDHLFEISVRIMRLGEVGTARWNGRDHFDLLYISKNVAIVEGDVIVTSGLSDIYPKGVRIGLVDAINTDVSGLFHKIEIKPQIDFGRLRYVSIIKRKSAAHYELQFGEENE